MGRIVSGIIDLIFILIFAVAGRASHAESLDPIGVLSTAWPFLVAYVYALIVNELRDGSGLKARSALVLWLITVVGGFGLRLLAGGSAAWPFIVVGTLFLFAFFFGWRLVWWGIARIRGRARFV